MVPVVQSGNSVRSTVSAIGNNALGTYTPPGAGAVARTVSSKLAESISVLDFGADPTGVADCTTLITAAAVAAKNVLFPPGLYLISSTPTVPVDVALQALPGATFTGAGAVALGFVTVGQALNTTLQIKSNATDYAMNHYRRFANHVGGTPGNTTAALHLQTDVSSGVANYEWALISVLNNAATGGQNVGIYGQGNKLTGAGPTWAGVMEFRDKSGAADPTSGGVGLEVDVFADGSDANGLRVGIDVVGGVGVTIGPTITYGIRIGPFNGVVGNCAYLNGLYLRGSMTRAINIITSGSSVVGIDTSSATLSGAALRIAAAQFIGFDAADGRRLGFISSGLAYKVSGTVQSRLNDDGSIDLNTGITRFTGLFNTGASAPVLTANKPGASTAIGAWLSVLVNGTQYWIPAWAN